MNENFWETYGEQKTFIIMPLVKSLNAHKNGRNQHNANILVGDSESSDESEIELK